VNATRSLAIVLEPFLPHSTETLWSILGLNGSVHEQNWESASLLDIDPDHAIRKPEILFKKIEDSEIEKQLTKLKPRTKAE